MFFPFCGGITLYTLSANKISPTLSLFPAAENPKLAQISATNSRFN
jgi:hypothetical protein